jgi:endonuclease/exonuclease/phosphatase family metal-dependent hydrolase
MRSACLAAALFTACTAETTDDSVDAPTRGELTVLNYNIAGLPEGISSSDPARLTPLISPLLNDFDLVLLQEDFWYFDLAARDAQHPYKTETDNPTRDIENMGDGLNRYADSPFDDFTRIPWPGCHGTFECSSDCLATKGFSVARHTLAPGVEVDVYNLHNEAGGCADDVVIRQASTDLILDEIDRRSAGRAVIVAGDFNLRASDPTDSPMLLQWEAAMRDACKEREGCIDTIERMYVRDGETVRLTTLAYQLDGEAWYAPDGAPLSDHPPQWARLGWERMASGD